MSIKREEIEHIAELSRLNLSEEEKDEFGSQLYSILGYVSCLKEINTDKIEPTAQVSGLVDVWRSDEVKDWNRDEVADALRQGELEGGQIKVKRVL